MRTRRPRFERPRTLDTRLLAQIAEPDLADYTLEALSAWLGVAAPSRHTALGDAMTTARIFQALVPKLREGGVRTLAEAMAACRGLTDELDQQHRAGWVEALEAPGRLDRDALKSIDTYPYRHRVRDVMHGPPEFIAGDARLSAAISTHDPASASLRFMSERAGNPAQGTGRRKPASSPSATSCARLPIMATAHWRCRCRVS